MCIGIPMKLVSVEGELGRVEAGGVGYDVGLMLLEEAAVGDYLLVHAGFAIARLDEAEAAETLELLRQAGIVSPQDEAPGGAPEGGPVPRGDPGGGAS